MREAGEDKADRVIAFSGTCIVADLDTPIALSAADLCPHVGWRQQTRLSRRTRSPMAPFC